jgi:hypothetical protein
MKSLLFSLIFCVASVALYAQEDDEPMFYFREVNVDYGAFGPLTPNYYDVNMGKTFNIQGAYYLYKHVGIRSGINITKDLSGVDNYVSVPVYFSYRTDLSRGRMFNTESCSDFLFSLILIIFPSNIEFNVGPSMGYFQGFDNYTVTDGYKLNNNFALSLDAGLKAKLYVWRLALVGSVSVGYMPTQNLIYQSTDKEKNGYRPRTYGSATIGLAFNF